MKKVFYALLISSAILGGIAGLVLDRVSVDIPKDVIQNLKSRYINENDFQFKGYIDSENTTNSRVMKIKGKNGEFKLTRYYDSNGVVHYNDNYLGVVYKEILTSRLEEIFDSLDIKYKLEIDLDKSIFPDETKNDDLIGKVISDSDALLQVNVVTKESMTDDDILKVLGRMKLYNLQGNITFRVLQSEKNIAFSDFDSVIRSSSSNGKRLFFSVDKDYNVLYSNRE